MTKPSQLVLLLAALGSLLAACRHAPAENVGTGSASFTMLEATPLVAAPPTEGKVTVAPSTGAQYREAMLAGRPVLPVYPPRALAAKAGAARVGVHVMIDTHGRVTSVGTSMRAITLAPPAFADDFRDAVETAVRQWKFRPAAIEYAEIVTEGGVTFERVKRSEPQETEIDLVFDFTEHGKVQTGK